MNKRVGNIECEEIRYIGDLRCNEKNDHVISVHIPKIVRDLAKDLDDEVVLRTFPFLFWCSQNSYSKERERVVDVRNRD